MDTLNGLDSPAPPSGAVTQAQVAYAQSQSGPWLLETLRSYPSADATEAFTTATTVLGGCASFTISWTAPPEQATETVQPLGSANLGDSSWSASISVNTPVPVDETMIYVQEGASTVLLEVASSAGLPSLAQVRHIAATAAAKLAG